MTEQITESTEISNNEIINEDLLSKDQKDLVYNLALTNRLLSKKQPYCFLRTIVRDTSKKSKPVAKPQSKFTVSIRQGYVLTGQYKGTKVTVSHLNSKTLCYRTNLDVLNSKLKKQWVYIHKSNIKLI